MYALVKSNKQNHNSGECKQNKIFKKYVVLSKFISRLDPLFGY